MTIQFGYNKKQVLDGLRGHFFSRPEIRTLVIVINAFAILSALLFAFKKIQALPFLLFSLLWFFLWISIRRLLPLSIYKKSATFQDTFVLNLEERGTCWKRKRGVSCGNGRILAGLRKPFTFFMYTSMPGPFFMIPKDSFKDITEIQAARKLLKERIKK